MSTDQLSNLLTPKRCVHCRAELPLMSYHCPTCGRTIAEKIPEDPYTVELRIVHNPTGKMLVLRDDPYAREPLETVDLRRLLRTFQYRLSHLMARYPAPTEDDLAALPEDPMIGAKGQEWVKSVREQIRAQRATLRTVTADNLPTAHEVLEHAKEVKRRANEAGPPDSWPVDPV